MAGMLSRFGEAFDEIDTYSRAQPSHHMEHVLKSETFLALAAVIDGIVAGGIAAYELMEFEQELSEIYI
jgi:aminoglycoside 3-N-acetyltransferase I